MPEPRVIYQPRPGSPIGVDREFYGRLGRETETRSLIERFVVPIRSGRAWPVLAGQICRIVVVEGAPVADLHATTATSRQQSKHPKGGSHGLH